MTTPAHRLSPVPWYLSWLAVLDRLIDAATALGAVLVLPVSLLLFLQWPLRDFGVGFSREANDMAQWMFALYMCLAVAHATRRHSHLAAEALASRYPARVRVSISRLASVFLIIPWSLFVLYSGWPKLFRSVAALERFPDTTNPGYFLIVVAMWLLALLTLLQAAVDAVSPRPSVSH